MPRSTKVWRSGVLQCRQRGPLLALASAIILLPYPVDEKQIEFQLVKTLRRRSFDTAYATGWVSPLYPRPRVPPRFGFRGMKRRLACAGSSANERAVALRTDMKHQQLHRGDLVEVKGPSEILATLDDSGT